MQTRSQTGATTSGILNSFQYLETGILLAVTPRINSGGMVTLEVNQEVSQPKAGTGNTASNPNPDVSTRNAKTSVAVTSGVPLLSKIPILGALLGSQHFTRERTELVLVITPKIVSDTVQAREVTDELRRKLPSLEGSWLPLPAEPPARKPYPVDSRIWGVSAYRSSLVHSTNSLCFISLLLPDAHSVAGTQQVLFIL